MKNHLLGLLSFGLSAAALTVALVTRKNCAEEIRRENVRELSAVFFPMYDQFGTRYNKNPQSISEVIAPMFEVGTVKLPGASSGIPK